MTGDTLYWRCGAVDCWRHPVLATYADTGGVCVRLLGAHGRLNSYVFDLFHGPVDCQCPSCGSWRRLSIDRETRAVTDAARPVAAPGS